MPTLGDYGGEHGGSGIPPANWNTLYGLGTIGFYSCSNTYAHHGFYTWALRFDNSKVSLRSTVGMHFGIPLWKAQ